MPMGVKRLLEEMRPLEIQDAAARNVPLLLPVGVLESAPGAPPLSAAAHRSWPQ